MPASSRVAALPLAWVGRARERFLRRTPSDGPAVTLAHARIYIVPSRRGLAVIGTLATMLVASLNYGWHSVSSSPSCSPASSARRCCTRSATWPGSRCARAAPARPSPARGSRSRWASIRAAVTASRSSLPRAGRPRRSSTSRSTPCRRSRSKWTRRSAAVSHWDGSPCRRLGRSACGAAGRTRTSRSKASPIPRPSPASPPLPPGTLAADEATLSGRATRSLPACASTSAAIRCSASRGRPWHAAAAGTRGVRRRGRRRTGAARLRGVAADAGPRNAPRALDRLGAGVRARRPPVCLVAAGQHRRR